MSACKELVKTGATLRFQRQALIVGCRASWGNYDDAQASGMEGILGIQLGTIGWGGNCFEEDGPIVSSQAAGMGY